MTRKTTPAKAGRGAGKRAQTLAIHLDRLAAALRTQGVELGRSEILEVAAAAFGHRNSHATAEAARRGEIAPPRAEVVEEVTLSDGTVLVVLRDPIAGAPYGVDETFLEQVDSRADTYGPTPYGHLVDLTEAREGPPARVDPDEPWVSAALATDHGGEFAHLVGTPDPGAGAHQGGNALLAWLVGRLSTASGCRSAAEATHRVSDAIGDLRAVAAALADVRGTAEEEGATPWEAAAAKAYDHGRFADVVAGGDYGLGTFDVWPDSDRGAIPSRGLFVTLMRELAPENDCDGPLEATRRVESMVQRLVAVSGALARR